MMHTMLPHLAQRLVAVLFIACCGVAGLFVFGEFGQERVAPMLAGLGFGLVVGAGLVGSRGRLFDALFPPAKGEPEPDEESGWLTLTSRGRRTIRVARRRSRRRSC